MEEYSNIYIVGIKGVAMCQIAVILKKMGKNVSGCDVAEEFITDHILKENNIAVVTGFDYTFGKVKEDKTDLVIYSAAHGGTDNPVVVDATNKGIAVLAQPEVLGKLTKDFKHVIAVCGAHGKTTTTSLLTFALIRLGADPSYMIGSSDFTGEGKTFPGGDFRGHDYFVIEADEYGVNPPKDKRPKLLFLKPTHILCTNVDFDHPDMYDTVASVQEVFKAFFTQSEADVIWCADDPKLAESVKDLLTERYTSYGLSEQSKAQVVGSTVADGKTIFTLKYNGKLITNIQISLFGEKNISNAAGVYVLLNDLGFEEERIKNAIRDFTGPKRRMEVIYEKDGTFLLDDYGHHPAEIEATITALKTRFPDKRLILLFQPHTFSRTQSLLKEFKTALATGDMSFVLPIFASAREKAGDTDVSSADLSNGTNVFALSDKTKVKEKLKEVLKGGEVVVTMGAGDVYKLSGDIIDILKNL